MNDVINVIKQTVSNLSEQLYESVDNTYEVPNHNYLVTYVLQLELG